MGVYRVVVVVIDDDVVVVFVVVVVNDLEYCWVFKLQIKK